MAKNKITILVADDEARIVRVLQDFLKAKGYDVLCAYDGQEALDCYYENSAQIDLILLDVMMPNVDGLAVLEELRQSSLVPVILLTAKGEEYDQIRGFRSGADDYIIKPFSQSVLMLRIEALLHRLGKSKEGVLAAGELQLNLVARSANLSGNSLTLTPREFELLAYFMENKRQVLSREQILYGVWGYDYNGDLRTVDTHVKQVRSKLGKYGSYIKTVFRMGYRFEVED